MKSLYLSKSGAVVQAGAGSGKTHSLVSLCLHLLGGVGREMPLMPRKLSAVTFTEKAAAELKARLRMRLDRLAEIDPQAESGRAELDINEADLAASCRELKIDFPARSVWQTARRDLDEAEVGTLHSVCTHILRRHAAAAGIDPAFTVIDPLDAQMLFAELCERVILDALAMHDSPLRESAERLCAETGLRKSGRFGNGVADDLMRFAALLGESGRTPREVIEGSPGLDSERALAGFASAKEEVLLALDRFDRMLRNVRPTEPITRARASIVEFRAGYLAALEGAAPGDLRAAWPAIESTRHTLQNRWGKSEHGQAASAVKEALDDLEEADAAVRACLQARDLAALTTEAIARHRAEKTRLHVLEFDDLTRLARDLLARDPHVRRAEKERIEALLIDEFQDTSRSQLDLCGWLAEERGVEGTAPAGSGLPGSQPIARGLLFLVGDRKQSIYEFRGADLAAAQAFAEVSVRDGAERHFLRTSYRSLPPLVAFANLLFERVLGNRSAASEPFQAPFVPGEDDLAAKRTASDGRCAELLEADGDLDDEAAAVARRIASLLAPDSPVRVHEKDGSGAEVARPVRGGDIAILMRSFLPVEALRRALLKARIPHVIVGGRLFHEAREVLDLRALLTLMIDRDDALALAAVLRSPFGPVSDDGLALLSRAPRHEADGELHVGHGLTRESLSNEELLARLAPDDAQVVLRLSRLLDRVEQEVDRLGPSALLEAALEETSYRAAIAGGLFGEQAAANVERLLEMARSLELDTSRPTGALRALLARFEALDVSGGGDAEAAVVEEKSAHAVRLLTIHAAKGLEFPVVFVPLTAMQPPPGPGLLLDPVLGLALRMKGLVKQPRWGKPGRRIADRSEAREEAQSRRLLYVAATRARDRVIFSGRTPTRHESRASWWTLLRTAAEDSAIAPLVDRVQARTLLKPMPVLEPAVINTLEDLATLPEPSGLLGESISAQLERALARDERASSGTVIAPVTQLADAVLCPRRYQLLHELGLDERPLDPSDEREHPEHIQLRDDEIPALDPAERGTLAHHLLERLPLDLALSEAELRAQAKLLLDQARVDPPAQVELIDSALAFLLSDTGQRLRAAPEDTCKRELPFALHLSPREDEPRGPALLVRGQIDLLLRDGGEALVLDYKHSRPSRSKDYGLQLDAYALAAHQLVDPDLPVRAGLVFLKARGAPVSLRDPSTAESREATRKTLLEAARTIAQSRARNHFSKIEIAGCQRIECGFIRRCHGAMADAARQVSAV